MFIGEHSQQSSNYYASSEAIASKNEKLKAMLDLKDQIISQKDNEIEHLKEIISLLKAKD